MVQRAGNSRSWGLALVAFGLGSALFSGFFGLAATGRAAAGTPFPRGFLFGTAIAGFQAEMGCPTLAPEACEDRRSDWYQFITSPWAAADPLLFLSGQPPATGPGFFETYHEDLARAKAELGSNALRLSMEWSRLFPTATFGIEGYDNLREVASPAALAYYHELFATMRRLGLTPMVTLNHYTLPVWIHDAVGCHFSFATCKQRGWADPATIVPEIAKYAGFAAREFPEVDTWLTLNEPFSSVVLAGFLFPCAARSNPPGVSLQADAAKVATRAMIEAHARMYDAIHAQDAIVRPAGPKANVGLAYAFFAVEPASSAAADQQAADNMRYLSNDLFMNAITKGQLDIGWDRRTVSRPDLAKRLDFVGVNYYARVKTAALPWPLADWISPLLNFVPVPDTSAAAPDGLYQVIAEESAYGLPIYVTETGSDLAALVGDETSAWLSSTLAATGRAIAAGYDVRGYFYWSLMDNYEWNHGPAMRFGLYQVDPLDPLKLRSPRAAAAVFRAAAEAKFFY